MIREGRERPADEFLGLGVVVRDGEVLVWSTTIVQVLGPLIGVDRRGLACRARMVAEPLAGEHCQPQGR
jgi:hypothetical protein